jgi:hypothetical protein
MIEPGFGLGDAAQRAARSWTYGRPTAGGAPARVWKTEVVEFGDGSGDKTGPTDEPSGGNSGAESGEAAGDPPPQTP